jgi:pimeloyl-ACP methyl ester carboxylesterase
MRRGVWIWIVAVCLVVLGAVAWKIGRSAEKRADAAYQAGVLEIAYASTRNHVDDGDLTAGHDAFDYEVVGSLPRGESEIMVVVHGLNNTEMKGVNRFVLARESLRHNGYEGAVVGFSWDGATNWDPFGATGYRIAKHNAVANGTKLAQFVVDLQVANPDAEIRLIGYSMGARLVAETVLALHTDDEFAKNTTKIASVHLVGAAIDDEQLEAGDLYGDAIESRVGTFFNYYSPKDSKLGKYYPPLEADTAVGREDIEDIRRAPRNYRSRDVAGELLSVDDKGDVDAKGVKGSNHSAYLGIRTDAGKWVDDGVMDVVAKDVANLLVVD